MGVFPIAALRDDFENNVIDPAWTKSTTGSATGAETGGQAVFTLPSATAGSHQALYTSNASYDLTGDAANVSVGTMVATGVAATAYMLQLFVDANNGYQWIQLSGTLKAQKTVAGVTTDLFTVAWSATTHKYLRIRESGGTVFFDTSTSASAGAAWTNRASVAVSGNVAVTALTVQCGASCGNVASPGSLKLDMVNTVLPVAASTWRYTTADWQISNRLRPVTLAATSNAQGVLVTADSMDASSVLGGTVRYFAGPLGAASGGYLALTEYASLALAQASAFPIPVDGRVDLPTLVDARYMRLYHRSTDASAHTLREFVPRRIVQADDIEAESIRAINIAAHVITADQIGVVNLDATAKITAASGAIVLDNNGITNTAGNVKIDSSGISIITPASFSINQSYRILDIAGATVLGGVFGVDITSAHTIGLYAAPVASRDVTASLVGEAVSGKNAEAFVQALNPSTTVTVDLRTDLNKISLTAANTAVSGGLNVGTATGAGTGQISTSGSVGFGDAVQANIRVYAKGQDATSSNYAMYLNNSAATNLFYVRNDGAVNVNVGPLYIAGVQSLTTRRTGWGAASGTLSRAAFNSGTVSTATIAQIVAALVTDLTTHGLIGA